VALPEKHAVNPQAVNSPKIAQVQGNTKTDFRGNLEKATVSLPPREQILIIQGFYYIQVEGSSPGAMPGWPYSFPPLRRYKESQVEAQIPQNRVLSKLLLIAGLLIYLGAQGALVNVPLWHHDMPPELDDSLTYVLKTKLWEEGLLQASPALEDLRRQLYAPADNPEAARQKALAGSRIFPFYHPLFSIILIGLNKLGLDPIVAFKAVWSLGPLIFGLSFAYFLAAFFGTGVAGLALVLLAFAVFPDTGLHYVVPSNLAMALAVAIWGRLRSREGQAPWTLALGSLVLMALHPIGAIYSLVSVILALLFCEGHSRRKIYLSITAVISLVALLFIFGAVTRFPFIPNLLQIPGGKLSLPAIFQGAVSSGLKVIVEIIRTTGGLFGSLPIFLAAVALGLITLADNWRRPILKMIYLYLFLLVGSLFYRSSHPSDLFFRLWIPLAVVLYGLVAQSLAFAVRLSWESWQQFKQKIKLTANGGLQLLWPLVLLAFLIGYAVQMGAKGGEIMVATARFMELREPLELSAKQPRLLLARAQPGDKVLYNSIILMPYYLIYGAARLGAVYYHPSFQGAAGESAWLRVPELRFAVAYNPLASHPSFAGVDETDCWIGNPDFYFSPLNQPRKYGPVAPYGQIAAAEFTWLELEIKTGNFPKLLKIKINNPEGPTVLAVVPISASGTLLPRYQVTAPVPARWSGWVTLDLAACPEVKRFRILLPPGAPGYHLSGMIFGEDPFLWPWTQKADLTLKPREGGPEVTVSFDPAAILPAPLQSAKVSILDDYGSSVLLHLHR